MKGLEWRLFAALFIVAAVVLALTTAVMLQPSDFFRGWLLRIIVVDVVLIVALTAAVVFVAGRFFAAWRRGERGARLSLRLTMLFAGMSLAPMLVLYVVSVVGIFRGIESWFDAPLESAFEKGIEFGQDVVGLEFARLEYIARDVVNGLARQRGGSSFWLDDIRRAHRLGDIALYDATGRLVFSSIGVAGDESARLSESVIRQLAEDGRYFDLQGDGDDRDLEMIVVVPNVAGVRALRLSRALPAGIAEGLTEVESGHREYEKLLVLREGLELSFLLTLTLSLLLIVLLVVWLSLRLGRRLTMPLARLATAAEAVGEGDYTRRLREHSDIAEVAQLNRSFNAMVAALRLSRRHARQRQNALREANAYMENLLSSLTTSVLTFSPTGALSSCNAAAAVLFHGALANRYGRSAKELSETIPSFAPVAAALAAHRGAPGEWSESQNRVANGRVLLLRASSLALSVGGGMLVMIDDITRQVQAEREATWEEASRRFVHEIKNPLTPVQLAAERLGRRLKDKLDAADADLLRRMIDTIVNQVAAMRQMVDSFRGYADDQRRTLRPVDVNALTRDMLLLYDGRPVAWRIDLASGLPPVDGDEILLRQLLHNLLGNACDAVAAVDNAEISLSTSRVGGFLRLIVEDNGGGVSDEMLHKICEPYVTTKMSGTGLGLAVTRRVIDRHGGTFSAVNGRAGLRVVVDLPLTTGNYRVQCDLFGGAPKGKEDRNNADQTPT